MRVKLCAGDPGDAHSRIDQAFEILHLVGKLCLEFVYSAPEFVNGVASNDLGGLDDTLQLQT